MNKRTYMPFVALAMGLALACSPEPLDESNPDPITANTPDTSPEDTEEPGPDPEGEAPDTGTDTCSSSSYVFEEEEGVILAEMENGVLTDAWQKEAAQPDALGEGYLVWTGNQYLNAPGQGLIAFKLDIRRTGTYVFSWRSAVTLGNNGTEHNDTWLRFPDAAEFYGERNTGVVYPKGSGKSPNPNGSSAEGWFKIYRSGSDLGFKWQAYTSDHDPHLIYVRFDTPGTYTMEVSARSTGHAIDRFALVHTDADFDSAIAGEPTPVRCGE